MLRRKIARLFLSRSPLEDELPKSSSRTNPKLAYRTLAAVASVALIMFAVPSMAGAQDQIIYVDVDDVKFAPEGFMVEFASINVPDDMRGKTCLAAVRTANQSSTHVGNDLLMNSGYGNVVIENVEDQSDEVSDWLVDLDLGDWLVMSVQMGPDGITSLGFTIEIDCSKPLVGSKDPIPAGQLPATTTTAPPTTACDDSSTTSPGEVPDTTVEGDGCATTTTSTTVCVDGSSTSTSDGAGGAETTTAGGDGCETTTTTGESTSTTDTTSESTSTTDTTQVVTPTSDNLVGETTTTASGSTSTTADTSTSTTADTSTTETTLNVSPTSGLQTGDTTTTTAAVTTTTAAQTTSTTLQQAPPASAVPANPSYTG